MLAAPGMTWLLYYDVLMTHNTCTLLWFPVLQVCDRTVICADLVIFRQLLLSDTTMPDTRSASAASKNPNQRSSDQQQLPLNLQLQQSSTSSDDHYPENREVNQLLDSLSEESKTLVKMITPVISKKMKLETELLKEELIKKDSQITKLSGEIVGLKEKVQELETSIDGVDQYERRDTIIVSGPSLPDETPHENLYRHHERIQRPPEIKHQCIGH